MNKWFNLYARKMHFFFCVALGTSFHCAWGANDNWTFPGGGSWSDPLNWDNGVPGDGSTVFISHNDSATRLINYDYISPLIQLAGLTINNSGTGSVIFFQSSDSINVQYEYIGTTGAGTFNQTGGNNNVSNNLHLGYNTAGNGTYLLSGGTLNVNNYDEIGFSGAGTLIQTGGVHNVSLNVQLGFNPGSKGTYRLSNGVLNTTQYELIGYASSGTFIQSGGTNNVGLNFHLGWSAPGNGTYQLSGGTLSVSGSDFIGFDGAGTMDHSAGVHTITGDLLIGANLGSKGTYTLRNTGTLNVGAYGLVGYQGDGTLIQSGGTQTVTQNLLVGWGTTGIGTYLLSAGELSARSQEIVGFDGRGTFAQSGGTNRIGTTSTPRNLYLGYNSGGVGTYLLSGGTLVGIGNDYVGYSGAGTFSQTGGTHTLGTATVFRGLYVGNDALSKGKYSLGNNSILTMTGAEHVGYSGSGTFDQSGGTHTIAELYLAEQTGSAGTFLLSGGTLISGKEYVGFGSTGLFKQSGGSNKAFLELGFTSAANGTYILSGNGTLNNNSDEILGRSGKGTFDQSAGTHKITGALYLAFANNSAGTYLMSGGTLDVAGLEYLGNRGAGAFNQSGGTHIAGGSAFDSLFIGNQNGSKGTYLLGGSGVLKAVGSEFVGYTSDGTFIQSGGTHQVAVDLSIGHSGAAGTFLLNGGVLSVDQNEYVGRSGYGTFNQTGGSHTIGAASAAKALFVGYDGSQVNMKGNFLLSGGTLTVFGTENVGDIGNGTFNQSGGVNTVNGTLAISSQAGEGTYLLSGGTLNATATLSRRFFMQTGGFASVGNFDSAAVGLPADFGTVSVSGGTLSANRIRQRTLSIAGTGSVTITAKPTPNSSDGTSIVKTFSLTDNARLDLTNNSMVVDYGALNESAALLAELRGWLHSSDAQLYSSSADATHGLGYRDNMDLSGAGNAAILNFSGISVDTTSMLIRYSYLGDSNLDGQVDLTDLYNLASHYTPNHPASTGTGVWQAGDFNYDGWTDLADLTVLAINWQAGVANPLGPYLGPVFVSLGLPDIAVPEPVGLSLLFACLAINRRRPPVPKMRVQ